MSVLTPPWLLSGEIAERAIDDVDRDLAVRARAGDRVALRQVFERHAPAVQRFVGDLLRDRDAAKDATQDTFVRVFQRIPTLGDPERLVGWIFGIARRVCLERRRTVKKHARGLEAQGDERGEPACPRSTPEGELLGREVAAALERALAELSADRRAVLLLRCDHLLSHEEIATAMGFSIAKVKVEIFRARQALRAALFGEQAV